MVRRTRDYENDKRAGLVERTRAFFDFRLKKEQKNDKKKRRRLAGGIVAGIAAVGIGALTIFSRKPPEGSGGMEVNLTQAIKSNEPIKNLLDDLLPNLIFDLPDDLMPDIDLDTILDNLGDRDVDLMDFGDIQDFAEELYWETRETLAESQVEDLGTTEFWDREAFRE